RIEGVKDRRLPRGDRDRGDQRSAEHREEAGPGEPPPLERPPEARLADEEPEADDEKGRQDERHDDPMQSHRLVVSLRRRRQDPVSLEKLVQAEQRRDSEEPERHPEVGERQSIRAGKAAAGRRGRAHFGVTRTRAHMEWWPRPQYSLQ